MTRTETEIENKINIYFLMFPEIEIINMIAQQNSALISKSYFKIDQSFHLFFISKCYQ
jgi:hypothetical protein